MTLDMTWEHREQMIRRDERAEGEKRLSNLVAILMQQKRMEDLSKALEDETFRRQLYEEFGIMEHSNLEE